MRGRGLAFVIGLDFSVSYTGDYISFRCVSRRAYYVFREVY